MCSSYAGSTVCIVDDDGAVLSSLRFLLEAEGFRVVSFESGRDLIASAATRRADCLVIDYVMPGINGLKLLHLLRKEHIDTPVVMITGHSMHDFATKAEAAGAFGVVFKPHLDESLVSNVAAAIRSGSGSHSQLRKCP